MKNIVLLCAQGMSTGVMVNRMREAAKQSGYECTISAHSISEAKEAGKTADVILLGPQVRYEKDAVAGECPGVPVAAIDMAAYGRLDGAKALEQAKSLMEG